jgi:uncharacterized protein YhdP
MIIHYKQTPYAPDSYLYRVGFAQDGWAVEVHRLRMKEPQKRYSLVRVEVNSLEGQAAVKRVTGGTMRLYPVAKSWRRSTYVPD